jgi:histidyl-tRNA synthetase
MERMAELLKGDAARRAPELFIASVGEEVFATTLEIASRLRAEGRWIELGYPESSLKSQLRRADKLDAAFAFIIGGEELAKKTFKWKDLRTGPSGESPISEVYTFLKTKPI